MNFIKIAWRDISSIFKNRILRVSVTAIIVVPLLYSLLYLAAFWDPYSKLSSLPVAIVNLDAGATKDGTAVNYGNDLVEKLKDNNKIGWRFVSLEDAEQKLKEKDGHYGMFIISEDFSKKVMSAKDGKPEKAQITFVENDKKNFLAAQINSKVLGELKLELNKNITKEYTIGAFDSLYEVKEGMIKAADGSKELKDGMITAKDGSKELSDGIKTLNGKLPEMKSGIEQLHDGSAQLKDGLGQAQAGVGSLYGGATQINEGLGDAKAGATQISDGLNQMNEKVPELEKGVSDLYKGSRDLKTGIDKASNGAIQVNQGIKDFSDKALTPVASGIGQLDVALNDQVLPGMKKISDGAGQVSAGVDELIGNMTTSQTAMANVLAVYQQKVAEGTATADDVQKIITSIGTILNASNTPDNEQKVNALKAGTKTVSEGSKLAYSNLNGNFKKGLDGLNTNMPSVKAAADQLYKGSGDLANGLGLVAGGAKAINDGLGQLNSKVPELSAGVVKLSDGSKSLVSGLDQLYTGSARLKDAIAKPEQVKNLQASNTSSGKNLFEGITALKDGSTQLSNGLGELNGKLPELQDGVNKLEDGSIQLSDGTVKLADGATELSDKLKEGADKITKNLINDSDTMGEFVSEPLIMDEKPLNPVKDYGTGFAPYFIPLSLWVGALMMFFVITDKIDDDIEANHSSVVIGKFLSYGYIGILQAVLVSVVVMTLGLKPDNVPLYFLTNIFMSFVFIAIIQSLIFLMGQVGRLLSIVLLILQLTSCAGTFPLEVVPKLFKVLNPFMPFTYCVSALREVISGLDISIYGYDISILAGILVVFLIISVLMKGHADKIQLKIQQKKDAIV